MIANRYRAVLTTLLLGAFLPGTCPSDALNAQEKSTIVNPPRLAVAIVVDQMRPDYLTRFAPLYHDGIARLLREGALFPRVYHDHAVTETAVGHATIATGVTPNNHGIVANEWYERGKSSYLYSCDDTFKIVGKPKEFGVSPKRLLTPTIGDRLKAQSPLSKVVAIALKDRAAVLMGGRSADAAFWYHRGSGEFTTSTYYEPRSTFLDSFNALRLPDEFYRQRWTRLVADSLYSTFASNDFDSTYTSRLTPFPHLFDSVSGEPNEEYYKLLYATPFGDQLSLRLGEKAIESFQLGTDSSPDLLLLSFSSADAIGHTYGPSSPEVMDYYLRLDNYLGDLFELLDKSVGRGAYTIVVTSDHGVMPLPEELRSQGMPARRLSLDSVKADMKKIGADLASELKLSSTVFADYGYEIILKYESALADGISKEDLQNMVATRLRELPYIADVYTVSELLSPATNDRPYLSLFRKVARADRGPDLYIRFAEFCLLTNTPTGTSHGSPYDYDTHVPLIFAGPGIMAGVYSDSVRTVDIAPTLAEILGIGVPDSLDGRSLLKKLRP